MRAAPFLFRLLTVAITAVALSSPVGASATGVELITSPDRQDVALSPRLVKALFTLRMREWPDGEPVHVYVFPDDDDTHERFVRDYLETYPYVVRGAWDRVLFTGTGLVPVVVHSEQEMRDQVRRTPGAIGYVRSDKGEPGVAGHSRAVPHEDHQP